jgi:hypothetical protein
MNVDITHETPGGVAMSQQPFRSTRRSFTVLALTAGCLAAVPAVAHAGPACGADSVPCPSPSPTVAHVGRFDGGGKTFLAVKAAPKTSSKTIRKVRTGTKALIVCQTKGSLVRGPYGTSRLWDKLAKGGYISDTRVYTGSDGRVAPDCSPSAPAPSPAPVEDRFVYDDPGAWTGPSGCAPGFTAGAASLSGWLKRHYRFTKTIGGYSCRQNTADLSQMSLHAEGRALDWMVSASDAAHRRAVGRFIGKVSAGNWRLARAMGIQELIWNHRIWTSSRHGEGWRAYTGPNPHTDHIHIGLNRAGAAKRTSFWR